MDLVNHHGTVLPQVRIADHFLEEHSLGQELYLGSLGQVMVEADRVADQTLHALPERSASLLGNAVGESGGGNPSGLGDGDHAPDADYLVLDLDRFPLTPFFPEEKLGNLSALARASGPHNEKRMSFP